MDDEATLWTIVVFYLLVAGLIGGLLPTWPLSVAATAVFALGLLMLVLVNVPEISLDLAQLVIAIAVFVGALAHLVRRVARAWWHERSKLRQYLRVHSLASCARPPKRHRRGQDH
jgi:H+/Cl- antiporter ClcA